MNGRRNGGYWNISEEATLECLFVELGKPQRCLYRQAKIRIDKLEVQIGTEDRIDYNNRRKMWANESHNRLRRAGNH